MGNVIQRLLKSNRISASIAGGGIGTSALIGACGGACSASILPLGSLFASLGIGSLAIQLVKLRIPLLVIAAIFGVIWIRNLIKRKERVPALFGAIVLAFAIVYAGIQIFFPLGIFQHSSRAKVISTDLDKLKMVFNENSDKVRIVSIMSPGCDVCQRAFRQAVSGTLDQYKGEQVLAISVWLPWVWGDSPDLAGVLASTTKDARNLNFWDEKGELSVALSKTLLAKLDVWDVYVIYEAGTKWTEILPPEPNFMMHQLGIRKNKATFRH